MVGLKNRKVMIGLGAVATGLVVTALVFTGVIPLSSTLSCLGVSGTSRTFTIIANLNGFNDSKSLVGLGIWPVMNVSRCDNVTLKIVNNDNQTHGLAVGIYAMPGVTVLPGQTLFLRFTVYKTGHFLVYCTITACTVHESMVNGQLNVT